MSYETASHKSRGASQHGAENRQSTSFSYDQSEHVAAVGAESDANATSFLHRLTE
jgi:hypothetical protein